LNYRSKTFEQDLIKATDGFVHLYFDNVGVSTGTFSPGEIEWIV